MRRHRGNVVIRVGCCRRPRWRWIQIAEITRPFLIVLPDPGTCRSCRRRTGPSRTGSPSSACRGQRPVRSCFEVGVVLETSCPPSACRRRRSSPAARPGWRRRRRPRSSPSCPCSSLILNHVLLLLGRVVVSAAVVARVVVVLGGLLRPRRRVGQHDARARPRSRATGSRSSADRLAVRRRPTTVPRSSGCGSRAGGLRRRGRWRRRPSMPAFFARIASSWWQLDARRRQAGEVAALVAVEARDRAVAARRGCTRRGRDRSAPARNDHCVWHPAAPRRQAVVVDVKPFAGGS